ncbi:UDP-glycosyltransferase 87A1-like [Neltuma alba]|uniref:UDP-glycosyltransferase 87A1-like n=1 Tax=Neltuma alba TaxID=207710 RepID=UPI0010A3BF9D|nr:UDP-glycosyltransferase 87A1-like [Prosopis alba]
MVNGQLNWIYQLILSENDAVLIPPIPMPYSLGQRLLPHHLYVLSHARLRSTSTSCHFNILPSCCESDYMSMELPPSFKGHVVALPFPTRGHVNPLIHLCKFLSSRRPTDVLITFVVTQEWLGFIQSYPKPRTIRFATIPNVIPLDAHILDDNASFTEAVATEMRPGFEQLLDQLQPPVTAIVSDAELAWPAAVANLRNIPVALLWTMSASFFETFRQLDILTPAPDRLLSVHLLDEQAERIAQLCSSQLTDLRKLLRESDLRFLKIALNCIPRLAKTDYLLLNTIQELEAEQINYLKAILPFGVYPIGPAIPFMELDSSTITVDHIIKWLDSQPNLSVLYISMGSSFSMSRPQMEELASALKTSEIRFLWAGRSDAGWLKEKCGDNGFPVFLDQSSNCRHIAEVWKNGRKVGGERSEDLVRKEEILKEVKMVVDVENEEWKKIREKAKELKVLFRGAIAKAGSSDMNMDAFVRDMF